MESTTTYQMILDYQKVWATSRHVGYQETGKREGYVDLLTDNLFYDKLSIKTLEEYLSGQGNELNSQIKALHSSSALCVNVFEYWRQARRISEIAEACGAPANMDEMEFEKKHRIPNLGTSHIDIEFSDGNSRAFAIEAKFAEPYHITTQRNNTHLDKYLKQDAIWTNLIECKKLAKGVLEEEGKKTSWKHLDVPQLLKHILSLSCCYGTNRFIFSYLWYDCGTQEARNHSHEIDEFGKRIKGEINFTSSTYQNLFDKIAKIPRVDREYLSYLGERYIYTDNANIVFLFDGGASY